MNNIVMQHRHVSKPKDEEGFATSRIEVKEVSRSQLHRPIRDKIPQPKQLIQISRPEDSIPRILDAGIHITTLPEIMNNLNQQQEQGTSSTVSLIKIQFNGKGKTLYDYFASSDFICVFDKFRDKRTAQQIYYDFTSRIKIVEHTNDYNWKLYKKLSEPTLESSSSSRPFDFDSNFESGNARFVFKQYSKPNNYYILLENDTNTHGYNQWFFFRIKNKEQGQITIHIMNMIKKQNLYKQGMRVAIFSIKDYEKNKKGWRRGGTKIGYNNTGIQRTTKQNQNHYCLSFSYQFEHEDDCVYFALTVPYTYSRVGKLFNYAYECCNQLQIPYSQKILGYTLSNNKISVMKIGFNQQKKKSIVILARQHPCETMGSFVCQGLVKELVSGSEESQRLLSQFSFLVVPMLNPDGVIEGNSRCNLSGVDLNRQWTDPIKQLTPQTHFIKRYLEKLHQQNIIEAIIDLHGHSKKTNSFFYCCEKKDKSQMRLFSILMSKFSPQFDYSSCTYGLTKDKLSTARGRFNLLGINCYTLQNSYFGWYDKSYHCFTMKSFSKIGEAVIKSLFMIHCSNHSKAVGYDFDKSTILEEIKRNLFRIQAEEKNQKEDSGSDSDPDGDLFDVEERLDTLKMKLLFKSNSNETILKGLSNLSKTIKYQSPLVISHNKGLDKKQTQAAQLKRRNKKHSLNLEPEDLNLEDQYQVMKKPTEPVMKLKKQKMVTERTQVIRQTRLASSLKKPSRLQYFAPQEERQRERTPAQLSKVHSNHKLDQFPSRKRPSSSYRTQTKFMTTIKNRSRISTKVRTQGEQQIKAQRITITEASSVNQRRSKSPNQKQLKIIEVSYLQQRRQRAMFLEETAGVFKSRQIKRGNLISDTKFKRFESFLETNTDKVAQNLQKQLGNRVFYRFPVL